MPTWTAADVIFLAPEFCDVPINTIDRYIMVADVQIGDAWGSCAKYAGVLLTAHLMTVAQVKSSQGGAGGSAAGPVQSLSVGQVSVSYDTSVSSAAVNRGVSASLALSRYGLEFYRLSQLMAAGIGVV